MACAGAGSGLSAGSAVRAGSGGTSSSSPLRIWGQLKRICGWCSSIRRIASSSSAVRPTRTPGGVRNQYRIRVRFRRRGLWTT